MPFLSDEILSGIQAPLLEALPKIKQLQDDKTRTEEYRRAKIRKIANEARSDIDQLAQAERVDLDNQIAAWQKQISVQVVKPSPENFAEHTYRLTAMNIRAGAMAEHEIYSDWAKALATEDRTAAYIYREMAETWIRSKQPAEAAAVGLGLSGSYSSQQREKTPLGKKFNDLMERTQYLFDTPQQREARTNLSNVNQMRHEIDKAAADARRQLPSDSAPTWSL